MITLSSTTTDRIVAATWKGAKAKIDPVIEGSARHWYPMGYGQVVVDGELVPFANLTIAQKLNVIDEYIKQSILKAAKLDTIDTTVPLATKAAEDQVAVIVANHEFR